MTLSLWFQGKTMCCSRYGIHWESSA